MHEGRSVFAQIMDRIPWRKFQKIIDKYQGDYHVTNLKTTVLFRVLAFAQLARKVSLRDTIFTLNMMKSKLYHMGMKSVSLNNVSNALRQRNWRIFADMGYFLIDEARKIYQKESRDPDLNEPVFAFDSTTIDLCLSVFPWAKFRTTKGGIKVHALVNTATLIPEYIRIANAKMHDVNAMDDLPLSQGAWYVMDRAYLDYRRLYRFHTAGTKFVTRVKRTNKFERQRSRKVDKTTGVRFDQIVRIHGKIAAKRYPEKLRRIKFYDAENDRRMMFLTNDFEQPAETIAALYKRRWQVELFFKWIKKTST